MYKPFVETYKKESDLLKRYKAANERAKYFSDIDDKLLEYNNVINFCAASKNCSRKNSLKRNQILLWTYENIADLFLQKNLNNFQTNNQLYALEYFENALSFARKDNEKIKILKKMRDIYQILSDQNGYYKISEELIKLIDDALKVDYFLELADLASNKTEEIFFLEQALKLVTPNKISKLKECEKTLIVCSRLLEIYEKADQKADILRIKNIKEETRKLIN